MDFVRFINHFQHYFFFIFYSILLDFKLNLIHILLIFNWCQWMGLLIKLIELSKEIDLFGVGDPLSIE